MLEAETNEAFASAARRIVVVADHSKWGVQRIGSICALDEVDCPATAVGILNERIPSVRLAR